MREAELNNLEGSKTSTGITSQTNPGKNPTQQKLQKIWMSQGSAVFIKNYQEV